MIFKRKEAKPLGIGDFAKISSKALGNAIMDNYDYIDNSLSYKKDLNESVIYSSDISSLKKDMKIFPIDVKSFYIVGKSPWGNKLLEAVPMVINRDSSRGYAIQHLLKKKKSSIPI